MLKKLMLTVKQKLYPEEAEKVHTSVMLRVFDVTFCFGKLSLEFIIQTMEPRSYSVR